MAIALDASTPAFAAAANDPWVSASFTPPVGALLVCVVTADWFGGTPTIAIADSLGQLTFTSQRKQGAVNNGVVELFTCDVGAFGGSARTLSATTTLASDSGGIKPFVFTGADNSNPVDITNGANNLSSDNVSAAVGSVLPGSWVVGGGVEWNSVGVPTSDDTEEGYDDADLALAAVRKATASAGGAETLNFRTGGSGGLWTWAAIAVRAAGGATTPLQGRVSDNFHPGKTPGKKTRFMISVNRHLSFTNPVGGITAPVGIAVESDVAVPILKAPGIANETDLALPIRAARVHVVGTVVETDTAGAIGRIKARTVGIATETDTAIAITKKKVKAVNTVTETDLAIALGRSHVRLLGIATETDTAIAITKRKAKTLGIVTETDTAIAIGRKKIRSVGIVTETDLALTIIKPIKGANTVIETDTALPISKKKRKTIGIVVETDTAIAIGRTHRRTIGIVTETDLAIALARRKTKVVGIVVETDTAVAIGHKKRMLIGTVVEIDLAQPIVRPPTIITAIHVDVGLTGVAPHDLDGPALERIMTGAAAQGIDGVGTIPVLIEGVASHALIVDGPSLSRLMTGAGIKDVKGAGI